MALEYFEEYAVGAEFETKARTVTEADIVNFVNLFGFHEPLFMDMETERGRNTHGSTGS